MSCFVRYKKPSGQQRDACLDLRTYWSYSELEREIGLMIFDQQVEVEEVLPITTNYFLLHPQEIGPDLKLGEDQMLIGASQMLDGVLQMVDFGIEGIPGGTQALESAAVMLGGMQQMLKAAKLMTDAVPAISIDGPRAGFVEGVDFGTNIGASQAATAIRRVKLEIIFDTAENKGLPWASIDFRNFKEVARTIKAAPHWL